MYRVVCVCILCFPLGFHPDSPRVLRVHRPLEQIREDRATTDVTRQLVASSSGIRAQGCHGFDTPHPPNFSWKISKIPKI